MANPVTWFEVHGADPEKAAAFYSELFGWSTQTFPEMTYTLIDTHSGAGMNGGIGKTLEGQPPHAVFYAEDTDIQALLEKAESLGATTVTPVTVIPDMATFAQFTDPFGNMIGLVQGDGGATVSEGDNPPVDWFEVSCTEPHKAWAFYTELFGWEIKGDEGDGFVHGQVDTGGGVRGGIGSSPNGQPNVTMYASVDDVAKYLQRAESLGAGVVMPTTQVDEHTTIAVFVDPQGVSFGVYAYKP
jgi:predicted enzyme related to lactoylglutathione lyase